MTITQTTITQTRRKAIFLDRDGTLNRDPGYIHNPAHLELLPGVGPALARLASAGYELVVVTNQSGVARGIIHPQVLERIHQRLNELLTPWRVRIPYFQVCTHHPDAGCECRKPKPRLILDAAEKWGLEVSSSFMVGDRLKDLHAGRKAGCRAVALVRTGEGKNTEPVLHFNDADFIGDSLQEVATWILNQEA